MDIIWKVFCDELKQEVDEATSQEGMVIIDHKEDLHPQIVILNEEGVKPNRPTNPIPSGGPHRGERSG